MHGAQFCTSLAARTPQALCTQSSPCNWNSIAIAIQRKEVLFSAMRKDLHSPKICPAEIRWHNTIQIKRGPLQMYHENERRLEPRTDKFRSQKHRESSLLAKGVQLSCVHVFTRHFRNNRSSGYFWRPQAFACNTHVVVVHFSFELL